MQKCSARKFHRHGQSLRKQNYDAVPRRRQRIPTLRSPRLDAKPNWPQSGMDPRVAPAADAYCRVFKIVGGIASAWASRGDDFVHASRALRTRCPPLASRRTNARRRRDISAGRRLRL
jgi:hypothetical protein